MREAFIRELFGALASDYTRITAECQYVLWQHLPAELMAVCPMGPGQTLLDLGCGTGLCSRPFLSAGVEVHGQDLVPEMLDEARTLPFSSLQCASLESFPLPWPTAGFDAVIMSGVTEFLLQHETLVAEIRRVLRPGGWLAVTFPDLSSRDALDQSAEVRLFDRAGVLGLFASADWSVASCELVQGWMSQNGHPVNYHRVLAQVRACG